MKYSFSPVGTRMCQSKDDVMERTHLDGDRVQRQIRNMLKRLRRKNRASR